MGVGVGVVGSGSAAAEDSTGSSFGGAGVTGAVVDGREVEPGAVVLGGATGLESSAGAVVGAGGFGVGVGVGFGVGLGVGLGVASGLASTISCDGLMPGGGLEPSALFSENDQPS